MKRLQRFNETDAIKALRDGVAKGYWTLKDLDNAPPGTAQNIDAYKKYLASTNYVGEIPKYRNLLREVENNSQDDFIL